MAKFYTSPLPTCHLFKSFTEMRVYSFLARIPQYFTPLIKAPQARKFHDFYAGFTRSGGSHTAALEFVRKLYAIVKVLNVRSGSSVNTFARRSVGDVLLARES
jgi:hypothetical protein